MKVHLSQFGRVVRHEAVKQTGLYSSPIQLSFLFKSLGLWILSGDFAPTNHETFTDSIPPTTSKTPSKKTKGRSKSFFLKNNIYSENLTEMHPFFFFPLFLCLNCTHAYIILLIGLYQVCDDYALLL